MLCHISWYLFYSIFIQSEASQVALVVKNPPANAGDTRDQTSIPGSGDPLEKEMATHCSILAWRTPWTEEPGGLQCMGSHRVGQDWNELAQYYAQLQIINYEWLKVITEHRQSRDHLPFILFYGKESEVQGDTISESELITQTITAQSGSGQQHSSTSPPSQGPYYNI